MLGEFLPTATSALSGKPAADLITLIRNIDRDKDARETGLKVVSSFKSQVSNMVNKKGAVLD